MPKKYPDDDGRVIVDMNVEGMTWYNKSLSNVSDYRRSKTPARQSAQGEAITPRELRRYTWYSVLAGLTIAGVFAVVWILMALFAVFVWFR